MHHHLGPGWVDTVNAVANLAIVAGYVIIPFTVLRRLPLTLFVRVAGVLFFLGCGISHMHMATEVTVDWWLLVNHVVQAGAVWCFVIGFSRLVRQANRFRSVKRGGDPAGAPR